MNEIILHSVFARRFFGRVLCAVAAEEGKSLKEVARHFRMGENRFVSSARDYLLFDEDDLANRRLRRACKYLGITYEELLKWATQLQQKHQNQGMSPEECVVPRDPVGESTYISRRPVDMPVYKALHTMFAR